MHLALQHWAYFVLFIAANCSAYFRVSPKMRQREHDGEATTSLSGTFLTEAIRVLILIVAEQW
jgi:hypothetical protein